MKEFKSRKFLVTLIGMGLLTVFLAVGKLQSSDYVWGMCGIIATYITGNAVVSFSR
jgi:hypothetical protein